MKKTIIALLALVGCAFAEDYTLTSTLSKNYNVTYHGFYLNLSEHVKYTDASITEDLTQNVELKSLDLQFASNNNAVGNTFQFVVLDNTSSKVLGYSSTVGVVSNNTNKTYEFVAADGTSPLTLSSTATYRYLAVLDDVVDIISADTTKNYIYNGGSSSSVTNATSEAGPTISGGLVVVSGRAYADQTNAYADCLYISGADGTSTSQSSNGHNLHVVPTNIKVATITVPAVPEPATATLSLLALAGLAVRRRRR